MQTRRDQLHAYRFLNRRALAALLTGEPNIAEPPMRRLTLTTISGIMIAVLIGAGFAVLGLIKPSAGDSWKDAGTVIVERDTGARFVYLDHVLHPVLNYTSAVLALVGTGTGEPHVTHVDQSELGDADRGATIGITAIPDSLPSASELRGGPWTVCSRQQEHTATTLRARVSVAFGTAPHARALPTDRAVVVAVAGEKGSRFVLWHGRRLPLGGDDVATSLGLANAPVTDVGTAFLDAVPRGGQLRAPQIAGAGSPGPTIDGTPSTVGQLLHVTDGAQAGGPQFLVVLADGVAPLTPMQTALVRTVSIDGHNLSPRGVTETDVLGLPKSGAGWAALKRQFRNLPSDVPTASGLAAGHGGVCAVYRNGADLPSFAVPPSKLPSFGPTEVDQSTRSRRGLADAVLVDAGHAALVRSANGSATVFVVAEPGRKYPFGSDAALAAFGYQRGRATKVPDQVLALIPTGPALDPAAARSPVGP